MSIFEKIGENAAREAQVIPQPMGDIQRGMKQDFGRYQLLRLIGTGGMAEVYLAEDKQTGRQVALKTLLPHYAANRRFVEMMRDEARIAGAIQHPHVAGILDFGVQGDRYFIVMEFIDGVDLASILRSLKSRGERLPLGASLYITAAIAEGLQAAHNLRDSQGQFQGVIHRDLSPHNILISRRGEVKLIDFGVAKAKSNTTETKSGVIKGKLQYMSPEQAQAKEIDARADIFSLGMTLYKMVTGTLPFKGQNEYQIYDQILRRKPRPPRELFEDLPDLVDAIILKSLRKNVDRRFNNAADMSRVLRIALSQEPSSYGPRELVQFLSERIFNQEIQEESEQGDDFSSAQESSISSTLTPPDSGVEVQLAQALAMADLSSEPLAEFPSVLPEQLSPSSSQSRELQGYRSHRWLLLLLPLLLSLPVAFYLLSDDGNNNSQDRGLLILSHSQDATLIRPIRERSRHPQRSSSLIKARDSVVSAPPDLGAGLSRLDAAPLDMAPAALDRLPPPKPHVKQKKGRLSILALPWAHVELNGMNLGQTPILRRALRPGRYRLKLRGPSGKVWTRRVEIKAGQRSRVSHQF